VQLAVAHAGAVRRDGARSCPAQDALQRARSFWTALLQVRAAEAVQDRDQSRSREDRRRTPDEPMSRRTTVALGLSALLAVVPARAHASSTGGMSYGSPHGGTAAQAQASPGTPAPTASAPVPASTVVPGTPVAPTAPPPVPPATVGPDGLAVAPAGAPAQVVGLIAAGNAIASLPYRYGGGHRGFDDVAYDCSGSVSYALHGAGLLDATLDSTGLGRWGDAGPGTWITVYANKGHAYLVVAGLRFDTGGRATGGSRWQAAPRTGRGFKVRHPAGL
jgi:hypothetical protein